MEPAGAPVEGVRPGWPAAPGSRCSGCFSSLPEPARSARGSLRTNRTRRGPGGWPRHKPRPAPPGALLLGTHWERAFPRPHPRLHSAPPEAPGCQPSPARPLGPKSQTSPKPGCGAAARPPRVPLRTPDPPPRLRSEAASRRGPGRCRSRSRPPPVTETRPGLCHHGRLGWGRTCGALGTRGHLEERENQHLGARAHFATATERVARRPSTAGSGARACCPHALSRSGQPTRPSHPMSRHWPPF